ncbi:unnamed protein product [Echinostoma caproni]|uniref:Uncharacterized protein n=1 Tax=Echinostoma caproni TaxID=27848 RepID=A0A183ABJ9_9TREM|nr:unnamed protein product [Echinostoma caproni]
MWMRHVKHLKPTSCTQEPNLEPELSLKILMDEFAMPISSRESQKPAPSVKADETLQPRRQTDRTRTVKKPFQIPRFYDPTTSRRADGAEATRPIAHAFESGHTHTTRQTG